MSYKSKPCNKGCGIAIHFDEGQRSRSGKAIPLEDNGEPHQCPNALPYGGTSISSTSQGPAAVAKSSNPIQTIVDHENHRDQRIRESQEQRLREHTELIKAMKELTGAMQALATAIEKREWTANSGE
jgi:hypothetical protein